MTVLILLGVVIGPAVLAGILLLAPAWKWVFQLLAVAAGMVFGAISAMAICRIRSDGTVMMTNIHQVFWNDLFLAAGAYVGLYVLACLLVGTWREYREER